MRTRVRRARLRALVSSCFRSIVPVVALALVAMAVQDVPRPAMAAAPARHDPREMPLLHTPSAPDRTLAPPSQGGSIPPPGSTEANAKTHFDQDRSKLLTRSMFSEEYGNPDGTHSHRLSVEPLNVQDASGQWVPVDTALRVDAGSKRAGAARHPLHPSLAGKANDPALLSVEVDGATASMALESAAAVPAKVTGAETSYVDVLPDTDLIYVVTAGSVKETILLKKPPAAGKAAWRFRLSTAGLTPEVDASGAVVVKDGSGAVKAQLPPVRTWDSSGSAVAPAVTTGGRYELAPDGGSWVLTVLVDEGWLHDPARKYPVSVDPTWGYGASSVRTFYSDGSPPDPYLAATGTVGSPRGDLYYRAAPQFNIASLAGLNVIGAQLSLRQGPNYNGTNNSYKVSVHTINYDVYGKTSFNGLGVFLADGLVAQSGAISSQALTDYVGQPRGSVNSIEFMLKGEEIPGGFTQKIFDPAYSGLVLYVDTGTPPPAATLVAPADGSVLPWTTFVDLQVSQVPNAYPDVYQYCFRLASGPDAASGLVVESGCLDTPTWTVPDGVLQDGMSYTWKAFIYLKGGVTYTTPSWTGHFRVNMRVGAPGPSPSDTMGPVTVNLANGNVHLEAAGPTFPTVGGSAGVTFSYNVQQPDDMGLRASYFNDPSRVGNVSGQQPVLVATERQVNADWGLRSPYWPALSPYYYVVRWEGYFQAPAAGTYRFAGVHSNGAKIWVNGNQVYGYDRPSDVNWSLASSPAGGPVLGEVSLAANQRVPIKVELSHSSGEGRMRLFVETNDGKTVPPQVVPPSWLFTADMPVLSRGWMMSASLNGGNGYAKALVGNGSVVLTDAKGNKHSYTKQSDGGYSPPAGEQGVLSISGTGQVTLIEGSSVFVFNVDGTLASQSSAVDSSKPAALQYTYTGTPSRLTQIKDPVSGRAQTLYYNTDGTAGCYGGATPPPGTDTYKDAAGVTRPIAPTQMLCRIAYWDGTETRVWYSGQTVGRIENPGSQSQDFGYSSTVGPLIAYRSSLVVDWMAVDPVNRTNLDSILTKITYNIWPGAMSVTGPAPDGGASTPRPSHSYDYGYPYAPSNATNVNVAGLSPTSGYFRQVKYDDAYRMISETDATGVTVSKTWNNNDQVLTSTDGAGRVSTTVYDYADRPTDTYGPAPASCFTGQLPTAACASTMPHGHINYDEGLVGLAAGFYDNVSLAGAPKVMRTGVGTVDGSLSKDWTNGPPVANTTGWSAGFAGEIQFPAAGTYGVGFNVVDGVRLWIDDVLVIDSWTDKATNTAVSGSYTNATAGSWHRIKVAYYNRTGTTGALSLTWSPPSQPSQVVPGQYLHPRYGLKTSAVASESNGMPDKQTAGRYSGSGIDPVYRLGTSASVDPSGLNLTSKTGFETPGTGYLRKTSKTLPSGAQATYSYYGDTETRANPCVAGSPLVNQGGLPKLATAPTPAIGAALTGEQVYDTSGRIVARAVAGAWTCTSYDARSRPTQIAYPANSTAAARTVTYNYAVGGDPLTISETDPAGTITAKRDLLGRVVSYTDVQGTVTTNTYDQVGWLKQQVVTPANTLDAAQTMTYTYDNAGRLQTQVLGSTTLATVTYDYTKGGEVTSVAYGNGSKLASIARNDAGMTTSLTWQTSDAKQVVASVNRTRAGTIYAESVAGSVGNPTGPDFTYDAAGRLTEAWTTGHHFSYDYTSTANTACPTGTQANAGLNSNRMRMVDQVGTTTSTTSYCYDAADRLIATTGATTVTGITYNNHGNTTSFTVGGTTTNLGFDAADRHLTSVTSSADPSQVANVAYTRDATNRIVRRDATAGDAQGVVLYGYGGDGDSASLTYDANKRLLSRTVSLPAGVLLTYTYPSGTPTPEYDHVTIRGNICFSTDGTGKQSGGIYSYDPFGQPMRADGTIDPQAVPANQPGKLTYGWLGQNQRPYEHAGGLSLVEMGARPYSPLLGRFLSVDPVEGGNTNDYIYPTDPINKADLNGKSVLDLLVHVLVLGIGVADDHAEHGKLDLADALVHVALFGAGFIPVIGIPIEIIEVAYAWHNEIERERNSPFASAVAAGGLEHYRDYPEQHIVFAVGVLGMDGSGSFKIQFAYSTPNGPVVVWYQAEWGPWDDHHSNSHGRSVRMRISPSGRMEYYDWQYF